MDIYLLALLIYGAALILAGAVASRQVKRPAAFFVADRKLGTGLLFSTILAANIGSGSTVGAAGLAYQMGLSAWWWVGSAGIGSLVLAFTVGPKIHALAAANGFYTLGDFLEYRFGAPVRLLTAALLWMGTLAILAGQLIAFAWILTVVTGTSKALGCLLGGIVVMTYFTAGGLQGTAWINFAQLVVKAVGFMLAVPYILQAVDGYDGLILGLEQAGKAPAYFHLLGGGWGNYLPFIALLVPSFIVSPGLLQKVFGARDSRTVRRGVALNGVVLLLFSFVPVLFGTAAAVLLPDLASPELSLPRLITTVLPVWLGVLLLAAVFSAEISTADAVLFMLSTSLTQDFYRRFVDPSLDGPRLLRISRITSILAGTLGILSALAFEGVISALTVFYGLLAVALFFPVLFGLYSSRPGMKACFLIIAGSVLTSALFHLATEGAGWPSISAGATIGLALSGGAFPTAALAGSIWRRLSRV